MSTRRLSIYYRKENESPVPPEIDQRVDIAKPIVDEYIEYLADQTSRNNSIPISRNQVVANYGTTQDSQQVTYTNEAISGIEQSIIETNFISNLPQGSLNGFRNESGQSLTTPDPLGDNQTLKNNNSRFFKVQNYVKNINVDGIQHGANVESTLLSNTGYNEANKFITVDGEPTDKQDQQIRLGHLYYKEPGKYARSSNVRTYPETLTTTEPLTIEQLSDIGLNIMFEAVQGQAGFDYTVRQNEEGSIASAEARMLLPSEQRLGRKVSLGRFTPSYQYTKLTKAQRPINPDFIDNTNDVQTYGSFYNVFNQFTSLVPAGQIALTTALIIGFIGLLDVVSGFIGLGQSEPDIASLKDLSEDERSKLFGNSVVGKVYPANDISAGDFIANVIGTQGGIFSSTRHNKNDCLSAGVAEFFGFDFVLFASGNVTVPQRRNQIATSTLKILTENGRLNVIFRELLRSGIELTETIVNSVVQQDFSEFASIANAGGLFEQIRDLKIISFINVLLGIGDKVIYDSSLRRVAQQNATNGDGKYFDSNDSVSYVDSLPNSRPFYISKSRLSNGTGLSWSNINAGMTSLPLFTIDGVANLIDANATPNGVLPNITPSVEMNQTEQSEAAQNDRLSPSYVAKMEEALESDYMPFYIQDLRTNEILAFHAFLEEVSEDFQVEYNAQEGYGRMDKVQIYKNTTRNISVNFKMVATNEEDHDLMWYKINRLAMVIYPQWTQGRKVSFAEGNSRIDFIQPFSQIPGATPVIRLRLGDLYKSNYSKMAVARLFGATTLQEYNVRGNTLNRNNPNNQTNNQAQQAVAGRPPLPSQSTSGAGFFRNLLRRVAGLTPDDPNRSPVQNQSAAAARNEIRRFALRSNRPIGLVRANRNRAPNRSQQFTSTMQTIRPDDIFEQNQEVILNPRNLPATVINSYRVPTEAPASTGLPQTGRNNTRNLSSYTSNPNYRIKAIYLGEATRLTKGRATVGTSGLNFRLESFIDITNTQTSIPIVPINTPAGTRLTDANPQVFLSYEIINRGNSPIDREQTARRIPLQAETTPEPATTTETSNFVGDIASRSELNSLTPSEFYNVDKNPILKAFRSSGGKGLAGVVTSFRIDYNEAKGNWAIDGSKKLRAPKFVTIQMQMAVIHDIAPGLDAKGIMNAPIWPVGEKSNYFVSDDPQPTEPQTPDSGNPASSNVARNDYFADDSLYINRRG